MTSMRGYSVAVAGALWVVVLYAVSFASYLGATHFSETMISNKLSGHGEKLELLLGHIIAENYNILRSIADDVALVSGDVPQMQSWLNLYVKRHSHSKYINHVVWWNGSKDMTFVNTSDHSVYNENFSLDQCNTDGIKVYSYVDSALPVMLLSSTVRDVHGTKLGVITLFLDYNKILDELLSIDKLQEFQFMIFTGPDALPLLTSPDYNTAYICSIGGCDYSVKTYKSSLFSSEGYFRPVKLFHDYNIFINLFLNQKIARDILASNMAAIILRSAVFLVATLLVFWYFRCLIVAEIRNISNSIDRVVVGDQAKYECLMGIFVPLENKITKMATAIEDSRSSLSQLESKLREDKVIEDAILKVSNDALMKYSELRSEHDELRFMLSVADDKCEFFRNENTVLDRLNKHKSEFLASIGHEIRTPLNAITGYAEILIKHRELSSQRQYDYLININDSARYMLGLVNQILGYAKAEYGVIALHETDASLHKIIEECIAMTDRIHSDVQVKTTFSADVACVRVDAVRIKQVISNLLDNAVKFSRPGHYVEIQTRIAGCCIEIIVTDTGVGIASEHMSKIFEVFAQANTDKSDHGTGIGLALSKKIVELHGGCLKLHSYEKQGTSVTIVLPIFRLRRFVEEAV